MGLRACRGARKLVSCSVLRTKWAPSMCRVCPQADRRCQWVCGPMPGSRLHSVEEVMLPHGWDGAGEEEPATLELPKVVRQLRMVGVPETDSRCTPKPAGHR